MADTVRDLLDGVARELDALASLTSSLQEQLSPRGYSGLDVEAFQSLDALTQNLSCLASFLSGLGATMPCDCQVEADAALSEICLSALANRLRGTDEPAAADFERCELF